ncbi:equilibrative nucleoside transporter 1 isoform X1 [Schistocerca piceifrons]|uniref:equilibrative nucleoside transporter 1 isoform X1 n=1 Tax=Schistocerca piceifrons TaxID=274613 RepID=UPI001F5F4F94|nr:equilibrative nucleoside transporter 1 isoform X1 [Schistocerca piceifrons]XP_047113315.1 equilibrative nucleoside transporter 1 isoform X1 [Schistocerca piceifrons]
MDPSYNQRLAGPENQFLLNDVVPGNGMTARGSRKLPTGAEGYEKQPLFERAGSAEPVRLTPAWEETNLPNDELNFKGVTMERADLEMNPPIDRLKLVYLTFVLHGVGTLMPWNMFINAKSYFVDYKLGKAYLGTESVYASNFLAYVGFAAQVPNLLFNWLNIFITIRGNLTTRIVWSIFVEVLVFIVTVIFAMSDTSSWPGPFFFVTMVTIVLLNMASGIYQNTVYGMAAKLPFKYTGAVILGANISGAISSIINIMSLAMAPNVRTAAIYYFITALFILLACFDTYFALPLNRFYRYHELLAQKEQQSKECQAVGRASSHVPYFQIFKQCFPQLFNVFFVFFVTLSVFPAVHSDIKQSDPDFIISEKYFTEVTCFLTFNVCAMLGSLLSAVFTWPKPKHLIFPVVLRVLFIPFFMVCKYEPQNRIRQFPVFIHNDWVYWVASMLLGISSGHLSALAMMYCPRCVEPQYASTAGMFGAAVLITGIFSGITFTLALPEFVVGVPWNL